MDYTSLVTAVGNYTNRSDLATEIPDFIGHAEEEMNGFLAANPVRPMIKTYTLSVTTQRVEIPADFMDAIGLTANDGTNTWELARVGDNARLADYTDKALSPGTNYDSTVPQQYKILNSYIVLASTPASALTLTLDCYTNLAGLDTNNASNWLSDAHGDVYLFGTLAHAALRVRDLDYYNTHRDLFIAGLGAIPSAYPERPSDTRLLVTDGPWSTDYWNYTNGGFR